MFFLRKRPAVEGPTLTHLHKFSLPNNFSLPHTPFHPPPPPPPPPNSIISHIVPQIIPIVPLHLFAHGLHRLTLAAPPSRPLCPRFPYFTIY